MFVIKQAFETASARAPPKLGSLPKRITNRGEKNKTRECEDTNSLNKMKSMISTFAEEEVCNPDIASGPFFFFFKFRRRMSHYLIGSRHKARICLHCLRTPWAWESAVDCSQQPSGKGWALPPMDQEAGASSLEGPLPYLPHKEPL